MVESTAKLREEILALSGVDIMESDGRTFKSTYAILDELSQKWKDLSDIQQATVTELIAGKRQGNIISSLMANFDTARDALETSLNSSGSAMKEHEKWQKSLEAQTLKLKASWQSLSQAFLSSDFLKVVLNGVINLVDGITSLIDMLGTFPTLLTTIATGMSVFKNTGFISILNKNIAGAQKSLALFGKSFQDIARDFKSGQNIFTSLFRKSITKADVGYITEYFKQIKAGVPVGQAYANTLSHASVAGKKMAANIKKGAVNMDSLKTATTGGKAALFGLEVAATAANIALTMGISLAIQGIVNLVSKWINAEEDLAEKVDEVTSKFKEQSDELRKIKGDYDTSNENSMISKYEKLSKGVDGLGRNVSLTADEYSEYQNIVNQIAEQIPSLVSGYDSQGNAILSCKDNVEELTIAYEKLIHAQNQTILSENADDIEKDWQNTLKQANGYDFWEDLGNKVSLDGFFGGKSDDFDMKIDTAEWLASLTSDTSREDIKEYLRNNGLAQREVIQALQNAGYDISQWSSASKVSKVIEKALDEEPEKIKGILDNYYAQFDDAVAEYKTKATALLSEAFDVRSSISGLDYSNISEELQSIAYQTVNSLDLDFLNKLTEQDITIDEWVKDMLDQLNALGSRESTQIEAAYNLQTQFNGGEISYGEYVKGLEDTGKLIDELVSSGKLDEELGTQIKLSIGLDEEGLVAEYQRLRNRLASSEYFNISEPEYESFIEGLSSEELAVVWDVIAKFEKTDVKETVADLKSAIELEMMLQGLTFELNLEVEAAGIEALNTALAESVSATGLSSESIAALKSRYAELEAQGYDLSALFEETSHGIHLNRQEFNKLEKAYATEKLAKVDGELAEMKDAYDDLGEAIKNTDDPVRKAELYNDRQTLAKKISEAATLAAQYEGLTSAYNDWLAAEEAGQERDMYENVIEGFENIGDEISRGWYDDGTIEFLEMLTGRTDLAGKSAKELKEIYDDLDKSIKYIDKDGKVLEDTGYSVRDFFTVDDEGNSTADGVYNF